MAKTSEPVKKYPPSRPTKIREVLGILLVLAAILLTLSLISHNASDPSANTISSNKPTNFVGKVGAYLAEALLLALGYGAYFIPIIFLLLSSYYFTNRKLRIKATQLIGYVVLLASISALIRLAVSDPDPVGSGGIIGNVLGDFSRGLLGLVGSILLFIAMFFISLVFTMDLRFAVVGRWLFDRMRDVQEWINLMLERLAARRSEKQKSEPVVPVEPVIHDEKPEKRRGKRKPPSEQVVKIETEPEFVSKPDPESVPDPVAETQQEKHETAPARNSNLEKSSAKVKVRAPAESPEPSAQITFVGFQGDYHYPDIELLQDHSLEGVVIDRDGLFEKSRILEEKLKSFKIEGRVVEVHPGPVITMFEFEPAPGIKVAQIANREDDLAMALRAESIRIVAPIPGKGAVGIEIPNDRRQIVSLRELIASEIFQNSKGMLPVVLGKTISGRVKVADMAAMPHLLVAGTTGAGKSVFVNSIICSLLFRCSPDYLRMLMVDPKMLELSSSEIMAGRLIFPSLIFTILLL